MMSSEKYSNKKNKTVKSDVISTNVFLSYIGGKKKKKVLEENEEEKNLDFLRKTNKNTKDEK